MEDENNSLDPTDWSEIRALGHRMMDDMVDHLAGLRDGKVWQPMPESVRAKFRQPLPAGPMDPAALYGSFTTDIRPYVTGNTHPRFFGWVHGGGNAVSMLAELLAGAMNANCGGRDHAGIAVERQVIAWAADLLGMPLQTTGVLLTGSSMANFCAVLCARHKALGQARTAGVGTARLVAYAGTSAHRCIAGAMDMAGLGTEALRLIPVDKNFQISLPALKATIALDRAAGFQPFLIIGTAGSVDTGAIDDLSALADTAAGEKIWFHVDAAFGALAVLSAEFKPQLAGIDRADSVAFDFHKWAQVTYDAGCLLVRDPTAQLATFAQQTDYLAAAGGLSGGQPWPCDLGPDLSRGFRALKIWMTLNAYGTEKLGRIVDHSVSLARLLAGRIRQNPHLELAAPVTLNIVCFRVKKFTDAEHLEFVSQMQQEGQFIPSTTRIKGKTVIRAAIVNHRTSRADINSFFKTLLLRSGSVGI